MPDRPPPDPTPTPSLNQQAQEVREAWVHTAGPPPAPGPSPPPEPPAPTPEPAAATLAPTLPPAPAEEFIEAVIREAQGDQPAEVLRIPAQARIPLKRGSEVEYVPVADLRKRGMLEKDYTRKTEELAHQRREVEEHAGKVIADRARMEAREKWITEEQTRLRAAQQDPEKWERYQQHLRLMAEDPDYAKTFQDAQAGRERVAEDEAAAAASQQEAVRAGVLQAAEWILEVGQDPAFVGVDLDRVRQVYAQQLERGEAGLDQGAVRHIFEAEAQYLSSSLTPLQSRIADLEARIATLTGAITPAAAHNRNTQHALDRGKAPPVLTGTPPAPTSAPLKVKPFGPRELPEVNAEWARRR